NLINANLALENTKRDLNLVLNRELETRFDVDTAVRFVSGFNMDDIYADIRENNASLLQAERGLLVNEYNLKSRKGGFLPTVGLTGSYGWNQNVFDPNSIVNFNQLDKANTISGSVVASLTWNIFDGGTTMTNVNNAKVAYQRQQLTIKQTRLQVERDAINAWQSYQNALYVFEAQKKNVTTNANNLGRTEEQFKLGQVTSVEFRQAQTNYLNAILAKNQAKYDAKNAELQVLQISGQLLNVAF
ncbi:MAG: TolC family protein, partial [Bacteroidota bacterium]